MLGVESALDASSKRLNVNVHPSGKATVSGGADVVGFPIIDSGQWGDVNWTVNGAQVTGTVRNRSGEVEGMFDGTTTGAVVKCRETCGIESSTRLRPVVTLPAVRVEGR
jgi:hypothetical protein